MLCPNCKRNSIKSIGDNQLFCLDCDWDNLSDLSEIHLTTPDLPFLPAPIQRRSTCRRCFVFTDGRR